MKIHISHGSVALLHNFSERNGVPLSGYQAHVYHLAHVFTFIIVTFYT